MLLDSVKKRKKKKPPIILRLSMSPLERASKDIQEQIWNEILALALYVDLRTIPLAKFPKKQPILTWRVGLLVTCKLFNVSNGGGLW
jgi:hypothetical protein